MVRKIRWSQRATEQLPETLEFWNNKNKSNEYSKKIFEEVDSILSLIIEYPELGRQTNSPRIRRILIARKYVLYYSSSEEFIEVKLWRSVKMDLRKSEYEN